MNLKFWKTNKKEPDLALEPVKERGYFETVTSPDVTIRNINEPVSMIIGPETAMKLATYYRCVSILSGSIASLPMQLKRKKNGVFMVDEGNPLNYLLSVRPNSRQTASEMIRNAVIQMVNAGNAYIYPEWIGEELYSLILLSPGSVSYDKMLNIYMVNDPVNSIYVTLDCDEIIHLRNMSLDGGYTGESTIRYASKILGIAASANNQSEYNFQPGNTYKGFISGDAESTVKGYKEYKESQLEDIASRFREELRKGETITYLPGQTKFNPLSMSPADIQLMEQNKFSVLDICRFLGVHPDKAFAGQSQNYKASEMSQVQYMTDTLQPMLRQISNEFYVKLISKGLYSKYRIEFDLDAFYQTDIETMTMHMEKCIQYGIYTVNEYRAKKGLPPVSGGNEPMISCNVTPLKMVGTKNNIKNSNEVPPVNRENQVV
mgnify:FL=1